MTRSGRWNSNTALGLRRHGGAAARRIHRSTARLTGPASLGLNLAPMVDVMLCLLIFFLLAAKMTERENARIELPVAAAARPNDRSTLGRRVVVNVASNKGRTEYFVSDRAVSLEQLKAQLDRQVAQHPDITCYIRSDRDTEYRAIEPILAECSRIKLVRIQFAAEPGERAGDGP